MHPEAEDILLRKYLLETLPEKDLEQIDLRIIEDEDFSARLSFAESELIEDFLDNSLSADDASAFRGKFLSSPERRQLMAEISAFRDFARSEANTESRTNEGSEVESAKKRSWFFRPVILIPAFGALILGGILVWQFVAVPRLTPLEREYATLNSRDLADISGFDPGSTVNLVGGTLRDAGGPPKRKSADLGDPVLIRTALASGERVDRGFTVRVFKGSMQVFALYDLKAYINSAGNELRVLLPKTIFSVGQFQVRVENKATGTTTNYSFVID